MEQKNSRHPLPNPLTEYPAGPFPRQTQPAPGIQAQMRPVPDCGETSYAGCGRLKGRKALVTGGDSGIGRAAAIAFAREGADVAISYLPVEEEDAQSVKTLLEAEGRKILLLPGDLTEKAFCARVAKEARDRLGGLDVLACMAGKQVATPHLADISTEQLMRTFTVNVFSLFWLIQAALPMLPAGASIITTASMQGRDPEAELVDYASTKGAIITFTQGLAKQLAARGIRVNAVVPGRIWTPLQISGGHLPDQIPDFGRSAPLERAGQPVELAGAYVFLASQESSYVTGTLFGVTGGLVLY